MAAPVYLPVSLICCPISDSWDRTDCRNTASKRLRLGATRTAYSHRITISSPIRARPAVSDSTTWWTLRRCFFECFQSFGVTGSFRDLAPCAPAHAELNGGGRPDPSSSLLAGPPRRFRFGQSNLTSAAIEKRAYCGG